MSENLDALIGNSSFDNIGTNDEVVYSFKNEWLNFCLYFPQFMYRTKKKLNSSTVCNQFTFAQRLKDDTRPLGGGVVNTKMLSNGYLYQTDFIEVDKTDIIKIFENTEYFSVYNGFYSQNQVTGDSDNNPDTIHLTDPTKYKSQNENNIKYFFKGLGNYNSFLNLILKRIV
jgi:hypothetical protein